MRPRRTTGAARSSRRSTSSLVGREAVVLGGGMSGLLAAAALSRAYGQVTVVERDTLRADATARRGVPQGRHVHVLLARGARAMDDLLPGFLSELASAGGVTADNLNQIHFEVDGHVLSQEDSTSDRTHLQSRPFLESRVLARVRRLPNVRVLDGHDVVELLWDGADQRVLGATVVPRSAPDQHLDLEADLVVSALGRNGRVAAWLTQHGYDEPREQELRVDLLYVSRQVRIDPALMRGHRAVIVGAKPTRPMGVAMLQQEHGRWVVTVEGFAGHHPPTDPDEWLRTAVRLAPPQFAAALRGAEPVGDISAHRFPANLWRRYDKLARFPEGLVVTGDSVCSFNPVYGQGMTVAALDAQVLADTLRSGDQALAARFHSQAAKALRVAWESAISGDLAMPPEVVPGRRPVPLRAISAYLDRYLRAAEHDPVMAWNFLKVAGLDKPARALFTPHAIRRVVRGRGGSAGGSGRPRLRARGAAY